MQEDHITHSPAFPAVTGILGAVVVVVSDWLRLYLQSIPTIDIVLIHLAKLGGVVITFYSILILHRNWKTGRNSIDPTQKEADRKTSTSTTTTSTTTTTKN